MREKAVAEDTVEVEETIEDCFILLIDKKNPPLILRVCF